MVEKLGINHISDIIELRIELQNNDKKYYKNSIIISEEKLVSQTKNYIINNLNKNLFLFGYIINNRIVSICGFYLDEHFPTYANESGKIAYVCNVYTRVNYRQKGYQRKCFEYCLKYAKSKNINYFKLDSVNEIAIEFYKKYGFQKVNNMYSLKLNKVNKNVQ